MDRMTLAQYVARVTIGYGLMAGVLMAAALILPAHAELLCAGPDISNITCAEQEPQGQQEIKWLKCYINEHRNSVVCEQDFNPVHPAIVTGFVTFVVGLLVGYFAFRED